MGPAVMPLLAVDTKDPGVVVKELDPPLEPRTIMLATRRDSEIAPVAKEFIGLTKRTCRARLGRPKRSPGRE